VTARALRVALYARVSTTDQDVSAQIARLRASRTFDFALDNSRVFVDDGVSGASLGFVLGSAFNRLREDIRAEAVDVVVAAKIDRLGRSAKTVLEFFDLCEQHHVRVVLVDQSIDTGTPVGRLLRTVMAAVAEFEGDLIRERTQQAMAAFKTGARVPKGKVGHPVVATPEKIARAVALRRENPKLTWSELAQRVGLKAETIRRTVRIALRTPSPDSSAPPPADGARKVPPPEAA
jgi:DNA invertase Pin-like site-specific DNA recombinase